MNHIPLNPTKGRLATSQPYNTGSNLPPLNLPVSVGSSPNQVFGHYSPRVPSMPVQMPSTYQTTVIPNTTFGKYTRPESPRISQSSSHYSQPYGHTPSNIPSIINYNPPTMVNSALVPPLNFHQNYPPISIPVSTNYSSHYNPPLTSSSIPNNNITPLKPSNI